MIADCGPEIPVELTRAEMEWVFGIVSMAARMEEVRKSIGQLHQALPIRTREKLHRALVRDAGPQIH